MKALIGLLVVIGIAGAILYAIKELLPVILQRRGNSEAPDQAPPFRARQSLLSEAEAAFYRTLRAAVGQSNDVSCKVRMEDMFFLPKGLEWREQQRWRSRVKSRHIDFVVLNAETGRIMGAIELADSSHRQPRRRERDDFVNAVFRTAGTPLLRVPAAASYDARRVREQ